MLQVEVSVFMSFHLITPFIPLLNLSINSNPHIYYFLLSTWILVQIFYDLEPCCICFSFTTFADLLSPPSNSLFSSAKKFPDNSNLISPIFSFSSIFSLQISTKPVFQLISLVVLFWYRVYIQLQILLPAISLHWIKVNFSLFLTSPKVLSLEQLLLCPSILLTDSIRLLSALFIVQLEAITTLFYQQILTDLLYKIVVVLLLRIVIIVVE